MRCNSAEETYVAECDLAGLDDERQLGADAIQEVSISNSNQAGHSRGSL